MTNEPNGCCHPPADHLRHVAHTRGWSRAQCSRGECESCDGSGLAYRDNPERPGYLLAEECDACEGRGAAGDAPKWVDLFGIDPEYTEGKPVDEWLEEQRGEA